MSILAIDRWKKRLWLAYAKEWSDIIFPIWWLDNTQDVLFSLAHLIVQHNASIVVVGYPSQVSYVQRSIDAFIKQLSFVISPDIQIVKTNEDYTSVLAWAQLENFKKTAAEDSLAAVKILESYMEHKKS